MRDFEENGITHIINVQEEWLEPITMFYAGYPISISVRMSVGNKSNNGACDGLSFFEWRCIVRVRQCVLRDYAKNSLGFFLFLARPHPIFVLKSRGIVMFSEI